MTLATVFAPRKNLAHYPLTDDRAFDLVLRFASLELFEESDAIAERLEL